MKHLITWVTGNVFQCNPLIVYLDLYWVSRLFAVFLELYVLLYVIHSLLPEFYTDPNIFGKEATLEGITQIHFISGRKQHVYATFTYILENQKECQNDFQDTVEQSESLFWDNGYEKMKESSPLRWTQTSEPHNYTILFVWEKSKPHAGRVTRWCPRNFLHQDDASESPKRWSW